MAAWQYHFRLMGDRVRCWLYVASRNDATFMFCGHLTFQREEFVDLGRVLAVLTCTFKPIFQDAAHTQLCQELAAAAERAELDVQAQCGTRLSQPTPPPGAVPIPKEPID